MSLTVLKVMIIEITTNKIAISDPDFSAAGMMRPRRSMIILFIGRYCLVLNYDDRTLFLSS